MSPFVRIVWNWLVRLFRRRGPAIDPLAYYAFLNDELEAETVVNPYSLGVSDDRR